MIIIQMKKYGEDLSGRDFGKLTFMEITAHGKYPFTLDFQNVGSIGSSFADEVVAEIAKNQSNRVIILNANRVVRSCLTDVATEKEIIINYS